MASEYLCAFLRPIDDPPPLLGDAVRLGFRTTTRHVVASKFLYYLLFHSPNPWKLEEEYLVELRKISDSASPISKAYCWSQRIP